MLRMIVRSDRIVNELGGEDRNLPHDTSTHPETKERSWTWRYIVIFKKLFELEVIQNANYSVLVTMLNDKQCFRLVGFMVAVITTFASTCFTIINTVN